MSRVKFYRGQQRYFLNRVAKYFDNDWSRVAKISNICERSLRDWRREKHNMNHEALLKLHSITNVSIPKVIKILPEYWSAKKFARLGALRRYQLYGDFGTPEGRRRGGLTSQRLFRLNPEYAKQIGVIVRKSIRKPRHSAELAEFIGIMLGDGGITNYQVKVTFNTETDNEYGAYIQKLIKKLFLVSSFILSRRSENANDVVVSSKNLVEFLGKEGLKTGNKIRNQASIPRWILRKKRYSIACLRGLVDTDGSFYQYKHKVFGKIYCNFAMCFTNHSRPLLNTVYNSLKNLGFTPIMNIERVYLHKRKEIDRYFKEIGTHNPKHLQKYKNYVAISNL